MATSWAIPPVVYQTTHLDPSCTQARHPLLSQWSDGLRVHVSTDLASRAFLESVRKLFKNDIVAAWDALRGQGAYRADLYRYARLFAEGGIYLDIKTVPRRQLAEIFQLVARPPWPKLTWYTVATRVPPVHGNGTLEIEAACAPNRSAHRVYNGIIATPGARWSTPCPDGPCDRSSALSEQFRPRVRQPSIR